MISNKQESKMITFFITYFFMLLFAALICNGWYRITREGMVLQFWSKFWERKDTTKKNYIEGEKLYKEYRTIEGSAQYAGYKGAIKYTEKYLEAEKEFDAIKNQVEHNLLIHIETREVEDKLHIYVWEEELQFRFPEWVRNPLSSCPICFSSVYGSIIFWSVILTSKHNLFTWAHNYVIAVILTWFAFMISLSFVNYFIHSKTN